MQKKIYGFLLFLALMLAALTGCASETNNTKENTPAKEQAETTEAAFPVTLTDALDNKVTIKEEPAKIVSLVPSNTEIAYELDLGDKLVGISDYDNYPEETANVEKVGGMEFNVEKIISLAPNLVLAHESSAQTAEAGLTQLRDAGITVLIINDATNFDEVYETIAMIGQATGKTERATEVTKDMESKLNAIKEKAEKITEKKKVYVEVSPAPDLFTPGKNTFMDMMLNEINAENATGDLEGWVPIDQEAVVERNPDVIITTYGYYSEDPVGQVTSRVGWSDVTAVKAKQVVDVDSDMVTRPGPRLIEGVEELAKAIYPEIFTN